MESMVSPLFIPLAHLFSLPHPSSPPSLANARLSVECGRRFDELL